MGGRSRARARAGRQMSSLLRACCSGGGLTVLLTAAAIAPLARAATIAPRFSCDTIQPFFHLSNASGPFSDDAIAVMAKFPMVCCGAYLSKPPRPA
eukprot:SAG11_NODE_723_length_7528_cov_4.998385_13_plen_96_part_00